MDAEHTKGLLKMSPDWDNEYFGASITDERGNVVADDGTNGGEYGQKLNGANARRLVACWNFCNGISTKALESADPIGTHKDEAMRQRDALLAALQHIHRCIPLGGFAQIHHGSSTWEQIDAAIAQATGVQS